MFLTFVVFACFATTRVNMRFRAENTRDSAQGYIQCRKCIGRPVVRTDRRTDVRTDGHVTTTTLPKFFGLIDYQEGVMNSPLGWFEVSGHRDVTT